MMPHKTIVCWGFSYQTVSVEVREQVNQRLDSLRASLASCNLSERVLLSTCNRVELYVVAYKQEITVLTTLIARSLEMSTADFSRYGYHYVGDAAIKHLLHVTAGLDSMVLGEAQILGQVTSAYTTAVSQKTIGIQLDALFKSAIRCGKRVRSETAINRNSASISSVAVNLAQQQLGGWQDQRVLVVGAGEMGRLAIKALRNRGIVAIDVANRTLARAEALVDPENGRSFTLDRLPLAIERADVVITAVQTEQPLIDVSMIGERKRPLILLDLGLPRNIAPAVQALPAVKLFDIDALQAVLDESLAARKAEVPRVEGIIAQERTKLEQQLQQLAIRPLIIEMRHKAETIRQAEVARTLRHVGELDTQTMAHIQHLSQSLINKLLHEPTCRLRQRADDQDYTETVRDLFGLA